MNSTEPWVYTYTGKKFHFLQPQQDEICIEDIAHSLSLQCRFNGHTNQFYSVAQHCVLMSQWASAFPRWMLFHDAAEAYIGDIPTPIKQNFPEIYRLERNILTAIAYKFNLKSLIPYDAIREADARILETEKKEVLTCSMNFESDIKVKPFPRLISPMKAETAEQLFLLRATELKIKENADVIIP